MASFHAPADVRTQVTPCEARSRPSDRACLEHARFNQMCAQVTKPVDFAALDRVPGRTVVVVVAGIRRPGGGPPAPPPIGIAATLMNSCKRLLLI
jgi:hypothetical protein